MTRIDGVPKNGGKLTRCCANRIVFRVVVGLAAAFMAMLIVRRICGLPYKNYEYATVLWHGHADPTEIVSTSYDIQFFPAIPGILIPDYCFGVATALLLTLVVVLHKKAVRHVREVGGLCIKCGYDLRASPERCPECGSSKQKITKS